MAKQEIVVVRIKNWTKDHKGIIEDTLECLYKLLLKAVKE